MRLPLMLTSSFTLSRNKAVSNAITGYSYFQASLKFISLEAYNPLNVAQ